MISLYYIFYGFSLFVNTKKSLEFLEEKKKESYTGSNVPIILLLPVLREQNIIIQTLRHLSNLDYDYKKIKIIVITSQKEIAEEKLYKNLNFNTIEIVKKLIPILNKSLKREVFRHFHFPYEKGVKSDQLNYALEKLEKEDKYLFANKQSYIGLYDSDMISNKDFLKILSDDALKNNFPLVYQQPIIYLKNYNNLPNNASGLFMKGFALLQTRYSLGYEIPMFLNSFLNNKKHFPKMRYCIGHGLFIRADFLKKVCWFPTPIEDTRFGHILSYLGEGIKLLPSIASTDVVARIPLLFRQTSVWFIGESYFIYDLKIAKKIKKINIVRAISLICHKFLKNFIWATEGLIFTSAIVLAFYTPYPKFFILAIAFSLFVYVYPSVFYVINKSLLVESLCDRFINFYPCRKDKVTCLISLPSNIFTLFLGPQLGLMRLIKSFFSKSIILPKTER